MNEGNSVGCVTKRTAAALDGAAGPSEHARITQRLLETQAQQFPDKPFLCFFDDGREFSYSEVEHRTSQIANLFLSLRIRKGDTVALLLPNVPETVLCHLACLKIGAVAGPLNIHLKSAEIQYILSDSEAHLLVTNSTFWPLIQPIRAALPFLAEVLMLNGATDNTLDLDREIERHGRQLRHTDIQWDDEATIIYTSGTTGKRAPVTRASPSRDFRMALSELIGCSVSCAVPSTGSWLAADSFYIGGSMVLTEKFSTHEF
jgi:acyl-CoA synthetase (AMP-forming)/AMP-acid ligase II